MNPAHRASTAALLAVLATGLLGTAPALAQTTTTPAPSPAPAPSPSEPTTGTGTADVVFTGRFVRAPRVELEGGAVVRRYQVSVEEVFGPVSITTTRVTVRSTPALETCGQRPSGTTQEQPTTAPAPQPGPAEPTSTATATPVIDKQLRVFDATVDGAEYVVLTCPGAVVATPPPHAVVTAELGEGRAPGAEEEPATPLEEVGFECPDTRDAVDLASADVEDTCTALGDGQSFDRAAAPGLALVIVGLLGLMVARRLGRRA